MSESVPSRQPLISSSSLDSSLLNSDLCLRVLGEDVLKLLKCGICMTYFDVPIVLPCGHTFCLRCLTEMCRQTGPNSSSIKSQDQRIGCPNCRVLIYASPILERNVTCNFVIKSLVECLKMKDIQQTVSKSTNTDESRVGPKFRSISDIELQRLSSEVDRLSESLGRKNVLDNAYFEVEIIRRDFLREEEAKKKREEDEHLSKNHAWSVGVKTQHCEQQKLTQLQDQCRANQLRYPQPRQNPFGWSLFNPQTLTTATLQNTISSMTFPKTSSLSPSTSPAIAPASSTTAHCHQLQSDILSGLRKQIPGSLQLGQSQQQDKRTRQLHGQMQVLKQQTLSRPDQPQIPPPPPSQWYSQHRQRDQQQKQALEDHYFSKQAGDQKNQQKTVHVQGDLFDQKQQQDKAGLPNCLSQAETPCSASSSLITLPTSFSAQTWQGLLAKTNNSHQGKQAWAKLKETSGISGEGKASNTHWNVCQAEITNNLLPTGFHCRTSSHLDQDPAVMTYSCKTAFDKTI